MFRFCKHIHSFDFLMFSWRGRFSVHDLLCFTASYSLLCPACHYGLILFGFCWHCFSQNPPIYILYAYHNHIWYQWRFDNTSQRNKEELHCDWCYVPHKNVSSVMSVMKMWVVNMSLINLWGSCGSSYCWHTDTSSWIYLKFATRNSFLLDLLGHLANRPELPHPRANNLRLLGGHDLPLPHPGAQQVSDGSSLWNRVY